MPRLRTRLAGILFGASLALLVTACGSLGTTGANPAAGGLAHPPSASPTPRSGPPAAAQNLTLAGDVDGTMTALAAQSAQTPSACTARPVASASWASSLYGPVGGETFGFVATVKPYNGPGTYGADRAQVQLVDVGDAQRGWESLAGDQVSFTVNDDNLSGTVEATLTNLSSNQATLTIKGDWSCAP